MVWGGRAGHLSNRLREGAAGQARGGARRLLVVGCACVGVLCGPAVIGQTELVLPQTVTISAAHAASTPLDASSKFAAAASLVSPSITHVSVADLDALGGAGLGALEGWVPGLQADLASGGLAPAVKLRGFDITRFQFNGLPDVRRMFMRDLATVERLEVLAGPAALGYGITSPGGVVNQVGKVPLRHAQQHASLGLDSDGVGRVMLDSTGPLGAQDSTSWGPWAYRLIAAAQDGRTAPADLPQRRRTVMAALRWAYQPAAWLRAELELVRNHTPFGFGTVISGQAATALPRYDQLYVSPGGAPAQRDMRRWALAWQHTLGSATTLEAHYSHAAAQRDETLLGFWSIASPTELSGYYTRYQDTAHQHNLRLAAQGTASLGTWQHHWSGGLDGHRDRFLFTGVQNIRGFALDLVTPDFGAVNTDALPLRNRYSQEQQRETALWLADRVNWAGGWQLGAGLRRDHDAADTDRSGAGLRPATQGSTVSHQVGLRWPLANAWLASLTHSTGVMPNRGTTRDGSFLPAQRQAQAELGLQWRQAGGPWRADLVAYTLRLDHLPMTDPQDRNAVVASALRGVRGVQLSASGRQGAWAWQGHVNLLTMRTLADPGSAGANFPGVARRSAGAALAWQPAAGAPAGWPRLSTQLVALGPRAVDAANSTTLPGHVLVHVAAQWHLPGKLALLAGVRNLGDKRHVVAVTALDDVYQGQRRTAWLRLDQHY